MSTAENGTAGDPADEAPVAREAEPADEAPAAEEPAGGNTSAGDASADEAPVANAALVDDAAAADDGFLADGQPVADESQARSQPVADDNIPAHHESPVEDQPLAHDGSPVDEAGPANETAPAFGAAPAGYMPPADGQPPADEAAPAFEAVPVGYMPPMGGVPSAGDAGVADEPTAGSGEQPWAVDPAPELTRPALEGLARRYASRRGLASGPEGTPSWRDPRPWFLSSLDVTRSFGLMQGAIGGGPEGELWYAEDAVRGSGGSRERWLVARYEIARARRAGGIACAVRRKHNLAVLGLLQDGPLPRGLIEAPAGDELFDQRYMIGTAGGDLVDGGQPWADRVFTADFTGWLLAQPYGEHGADATCFQLQGGVVCVYAAGWPGTAEELDAFCGRAARIAAQLERVA
jgi:hypothetical protein